MMHKRFPCLTASRRTLLALSAIGFTLLPSLAPLQAHADPPPPVPGETPFLFGCDWPVNGSPAVKSLFYETGCNFVRITGGGYGWALEGHKKALQELDTHGVKALLQLGSHYPDARYFAFKDDYLFDQAGATGKEDRNAWAITYNGSSWPQYSYAGSTFRKELTRDFTNYLNGVKDCSNVTSLLLHNEPGYHWINDRVFDYNPQSIARFRTWLQQKHGTLENLNSRWGTNFTSFDTIDPPHDLPPVSNIAAWLDWRRFNADLIQDFLHSERDFARQARPTLPATTNLSGPLDNWYPIRLGDNYRFTSEFDIAGIDIYPTEWTNPVFPGYTMDMTRGAAPGKKLYVVECEVFDPTRFKGLSEEVRAGMLRGEVWNYIGHGADVILLWSLSGQGGFRLTQGEFNARVAATREIAHLAPMLHVGAFAKPAARVALCVDQDSYIYYGGLAPKLDGGGKVDQAARGLYGALAGGRYGVDIVSADQVREGIGKRYAALVLATPVLMDTELAGQITTFVNNGGLLIAEAPFAARDRWGKALPNSAGFGLDAVLGIRDVQGEQSGSSPSGTITTPSGSFAGVGQTRFQLASARVIGTFADKQPAVTVNRVGKGTAVYIAAEVGGPNYGQWSTGKEKVSGLQTFLAATLAQQGKIPPAVNVTHQGATYLDSAVRTDAHGNRLVVLTTATDKGKPLPAATNVQLSTIVPPAQVFAFPPARYGNGRVVAGPQLIRAQRAGSGSSARTVLSLPDVDSALPVLLAQDFSPLVTIDAPEAASAGTEVEVKVTCYNPSAKPLRVTPTLVAPGTWKSLTPPAPVTIPARGERSVALRIRAGGEERAVLLARLTSATGRVDSVPVDVLAQAKQ